MDWIGSEKMGPMSNSGLYITPLSWLERHSNRSVTTWLHVRSVYGTRNKRSHTWTSGVDQNPGVGSAIRRLGGKAEKEGMGQKTLFIPALPFSHLLLTLPSINQSFNHEFLEWPKYLKHCLVHYRQCADTDVSNAPNVRIWFSEQKRLESSAEGCQRWRRRNLLWQAVPHLGPETQKCSAANSGAVNRRLDEAVT